MTNIIDTIYLENGTRNRKRDERVLVDVVEFQKLVDYIKKNHKKRAHNYFNKLVTQETVTTESNDIWIMDEDFEAVYWAIENFTQEFDHIKFEDYSEETMKKEIMKDSYYDNYHWDDEDDTFSY